MDASFYQIPFLPIFPFFSLNSINQGIVSTSLVFATMFKDSFVGYSTQCSSYHTPSLISITPSLHPPPFPLIFLIVILDIFFLLENFQNSKFLCLDVLFRFTLASLYHFYSFEYFIYEYTHMYIHSETDFRFSFGAIFL